MDTTKIRSIRQASHAGDSVVYVMSRDQRVRDNHALLHAQQLAKGRKVPLYVLFVLRSVKGRSREHYAFMLDGLANVATALANYNVRLVLRTGQPAVEIQTFAAEVQAGSIVFDFSPLSDPRAIVDSISKSFAGSVNVVDTHNIIPVWQASDKQEFAAHTFRRKVHKQLARYLSEPGVLPVHPHDSHPVDSLSFAEARKYIEKIPASSIRIEFDSGEDAAANHLDRFIDEDLADYATKRNDFADDHQSNLSPYLHYGQISSLRVALDVMKSVDSPPLLLREARMAQAEEYPSREDGMNALLEEMIVRKELSDNYCYYNSHYKSLSGAPAWAIQTLQDHRDDRRDFIYSTQDWERAGTHDDAWNAAQRQLARTGKLHGYLRMYWAKKLLEWSDSPETAIDTAIYLNDKYSIDGGDPNGYVGILWAIAGLHDRPWSERSVFGKIRYMNTAGLKRKYDLNSYIRAWPEKEPV